MAEFLLPLNNLITVVTPVMEDNFCKCMVSRTGAIVSGFYEVFTITMNASEYALGATLSQEGDRGNRPTAYASMRLTEAETWYNVLERELRRIIWAVHWYKC